MCVDRNTHTCVYLHTNVYIRAHTRMPIFIGTYTMYIFIYIQYIQIHQYENVPVLHIASSFTVKKALQYSAHYSRFCEAQHGTHAKESQRGGL